MKKVFIWLFGVLIVLVGLVYVLLFTQIGNNILKPVVRVAINKYSPIPLEVQNFSLRLSRFDIALAHQDAVLAHFWGDFSLFSQTIDAKFDATFKDLSVLNPMVGMPLKGGFQIDSSIQGKFGDLLVKTTSNLADSKTKLEARLIDYDLADLNADITDLHLEKLLPIIGQKPYASGIFKLKADVKKNQNHGYDGQITANITDGLLNQKLVKNDFKIPVPKVDFLLALQADFNDKSIQDSLSFTSNVGNFTTSGTIAIPDMRIANVYEAKFSDLSPLSPIVKIPLRGSAQTSGEITGNQQDLHIKGKSDIADSQTLYDVNLKNFALTAVDFDIKKLAIQKILWMFYQPQYAHASADMQGNISDFATFPSIKFTGNITGKTINAPIKKQFEIDMPDTAFDSKIALLSKNGTGKLDFDFDSPIGSLKLNQADVDMTKPLFDGKFHASLPDLKKLKFITGVGLVGSFDVDGKLRYAGGLHADFHSNSLGGNLQGVFENDTLKSDFKDIPVKRLIGLLEIPDVFDAMASGGLDYNITTQKGKIWASVKNGSIVRSDFTQLIKKYAKFDLASEVFETTDFTSSIDKKLLNAKLSMQSKDVRIESNKMLIDLEKSQIASKIRLSLQKDYIDVGLNGNLKSPKVDIDASALLKKQAVEAIDKGADKAIEKYVPKENQENVKKLLNGILKKF
ncbi:hypothetical protein [Helicobacter sp. 11S02596-1]|uniref:hypothetical protein n=1 Tax=Helicobacter sp. 11S02596-1 TaxID=1476194 RepID=UPI000BA67E2B|nr:hypothetical protein [Helicobacter sp. 11S02596-1]PAF44863.1 hypothetical protein BJI48_02445 [Helicobacter sp. 11S02596-1]